MRLIGRLKVQHSDTLLQQGSLIHSDSQQNNSIAMFPYFSLEENKKKGKQKGCRGQSVRSGVLCFEHKCCRQIPPHLFSFWANRTISYEFTEFRDEFQSLLNFWMSYSTTDQAVEDFPSATIKGQSNCQEFPIACVICLFGRRRCESLSTSLINSWNTAGALANLKGWCLQLPLRAMKTDFYSSF